MASSLKNLSVLLSPKFLSPLSPSRNLVSIPKSDGKIYFRQRSRSYVPKKLNFSSGTKNVTAKFESDFKQSTRIPDIKIDCVPDDMKWDFQNKCASNKHSNILDINTPNKLNLVKYGLDKFKNCTTVLGKGTFGTVFKGKHKGQTVAVKIVTSETCSREKNAISLANKNIVRTLEIIENSEYQNYSLIIMEYLPNCRSLQEVLDNFYIEESTGNSAIHLKQFAVDITTGLNYLHRNGVIHLDLKPRNILVDAQKVCRICDFGNSAKIDDSFEEFKHNGTIIYTAPEILLGKTPTTKSDIYSLGLVFWQIKYKKIPFQEYETMESIIYNIGKYAIRPAYENENPDAFVAIFVKCWNNKPELRPNTLDILKELNNVRL